MNSFIYAVVALCQTSCSVFNSFASIVAKSFFTHSQRNDRYLQVRKGVFSQNIEQKDEHKEKTTSMASNWVQNNNSPIYTMQTIANWNTHYLCISLVGAVTDSVI